MSNSRSIGVIFINICQYAIPDVGSWPYQFMEAMFWIYVTLSFTSSAGMYLILWSTQYALPG